MSSQTPNIGLTLPVGSENVSRQIINENNTKIDTAFGGTAGRELLGYKENGDTASQAISDGSFVVWKGNLYKANGNISQGATLSVSNLTAVSSGGFNDLQGQVDSLSDSLAKMPKTVMLSNPHGINVNNGYAYWSIGNLQVSDISTIKNIVASVQISGNSEPCYGAGWNSTNVFAFFKPGTTVTAPNFSASFTIMFN